MAAADRLSSRYALRLMYALADAGDRVGAVRFAQAHERIVRAELGTSPDPTITRLATEMRAALASNGTTPNADAPNESALTPSVDVAGAISTAAPATAEGLGAMPPGTTAPVNMFRAQLRRPGAGLAATAGLVVLAALGYGTLEPLLGHRRSAEPVQPERRTEMHTPSIAAYELYVRGNDALVFRSDSSLFAGIESLDRATRSHVR